MNGHLVDRFARSSASRWRFRNGALRLVITLLLVAGGSAHAQWQVMTAGDQRQSKPPKSVSNGTPIKPGDRWPTDNKFRWLIGDLAVPELIGKESSVGKIVGLQINVGDGGEVWRGGELEARFDNDHPALVVVATNAVPGGKVRVEVQVYGKVQGRRQIRTGFHSPARMVMSPASRPGM